MVSKKQQVEFNRKVINLMLQSGATKYIDHPDFGTFELDTIAGVLTVSVHVPERAETYSIFCRFESAKHVPLLIKQQERFNHYSGKWNWHNANINFLSDFERDLQFLINRNSNN